MIGWLRGTLRRKEASRLLVETGGVGYLVQIPISTFFGLPDVGSEVALHVHTHVREDALQLFGFLTELELEMFLRLIAVSGIGPRMGVNILSGIPAADLIEALRTADIKRLTAVPGLGKKTSERLLVELRDKVDDLVPGSATAASRPARRDPDRDDAVSALVNLGYRRKDAEDAVDQVRTQASAGLEALLKAALAALSR